MIRAFLPKVALLLVLCLALAVSPLQAAEPGLYTRHVSPGSALWEFLARAWTHLTSVWAANGCLIDPSGRCQPSSTAEADNGCGLDPSGRCLSSATAEADNGCILDPSGRCGS